MPSDPDELASAHVCDDYYDKKLLTQVCTQKRAEVSAKPCDRKGAIGACKGEDSDRWYYDDDSMDAQQLSKLCAPKPVILPTGGALTAKSDSVVNAEKIAGSVARYGAKAKANLASLPAIAKKLPAATGKVDLQALKGEVLVIHAEDLVDPEHPKSIAYRLAGTDAVGACQRILAGRPLAKEDPYVLHACAERQVLAVIMVGTFKDPEWAGQTKDAKSKTTFVKKGRVAGDVLFFRLGDGRYLGSFSFDAENGPISPSTTLEKLKAELLVNYVNALNAQAAARTPALAPRFSMTP